MLMASMDWCSLLWQACMRTSPSVLTPGQHWGQQHWGQQHCASPAFCHTMRYCLMFVFGYRETLVA